MSDADVSITSASSMGMGIGGWGRPISVSIIGPDIDELSRIAEAVATEMRNTRGVMDVQSD